MTLLSQRFHTVYILSKNINFNKNEMESKMEDPPPPPLQSFRETNLVLELI